MKKLLLAGAMTGLLMASLSPAQAALTLSLSDSAGHSVTLNDADGDGVISYNGTLSPSGSDWLLNVTTGVSSPFLNPGRMDLNSINVSSGTPGILTIRLTDDSFSGPASMSTVIGGTTEGRVTYKTYAGSAPLTSMSFDSINSEIISGSGSSSISAQAAYAMIQEVVIEHGRGINTTSFDASLTVVPEPTTVLAGALLLLPFGLSTFRLLRKKA